MLVISKHDYDRGKSTRRVTCSNRNITKCCYRIGKYRSTQKIKLRPRGIDMQNNNAVSVITGSAAQVPKETAEALGIDILPLLIYVDGKEYHDGIAFPRGNSIRGCV